MTSLDLGLPKNYDALIPITTEYNNITFVHSHVWNEPLAAYMNTFSARAGATESANHIVWWFEKKVVYPQQSPQEIGLNPFHGGTLRVKDSALATPMRPAAAVPLKEEAARENEGHQDPSMNRSLDSAAFDMRNLSGFMPGPPVNAPKGPRKWLEAMERRVPVDAPEGPATWFKNQRRNY